MPLIIFVLVVIVVISWARSVSKEANKSNKRYTAAARITNAEKEKCMIDSYVRQGKDIDEAVELAREFMIRSGFEPCIPKEAYRYNTSCYNYQKYDSEAVKKLRNDYRRECRAKGVSCMKFEERKYVYESGRLPTTAAQYSAYLSDSINSHKYDAVSVGRYVSHKNLGTCEVIDLDYDRSVHIVKVVKNGETKEIPFGDKNITKL